MEAPDFLAKEWPVISGAPYHFFGGIITITVLTVAIIWFLFNWVYRHRFAAKDDQLAAREERLTQAKEKQQDAEQKSKDLQSVIEKLTAQLDAKASIEEITITASSAKTKVGELMIANNAVRSAIGIAIGASSATGITDMSFQNTPLVLREEAERIKAEKERLK
jgi:hypothetical protein